MARQSAARVGSLIAVGVLTVLLCLGVIYLYVGWAPFTDEPGFSLSDTGYAALAIGLFAALFLGVALAALILHDKRRS
jgi:hypothetical protein